MTYPEGRQPLSWTDLNGPHSTWEAEAKALRIENSRLIEERDRALTWRDKDWQASQDNTALRARVRELEAALRDVIGMTDQIAKAPMTADRWADRIEDHARAALEAKP